MMNYTRKVALNTVAQFVGKIVGLAISLATIAIIFRFLGVEGVGKYTTSFAFVAFFALFADLGLGWTMLRELAIEKDQNKVFNNIFTMRLILGILVFLIASLVVWLFKYPLEVKWAVAILSVSYFFQSLVSVAVSIYLNKYRMDIATGAEVVGKAIILAVIYFLSRSGGTLVSVMDAYVVGCLINFLIVWLYASKFISIGLAFDWKYWKHAISLALPIGVTLVFGFIYYKIDSIMLSLMKSMIDVGIYGTAYKILEVLQMFPALFLGAAFTLITSYVTTKDARLQSAFQKQFDFLALLAAPIVAGTLILAGQIIGFIAGSKGDFISASTLSFAGHAITSVTCLRILILSVGISFFTTLYSFMIVSLGKQKQMVWPTIGFAVFNFLINLYLIPRFSYLGAAFSTFITEIIVFSTVRYIVKSNVSLSVRFNNFAKIILCAIFMSGATYALYLAGAGLILNLVISIIVYALLAYALQVISKDLLKSVLKMGD